MMSKKNKYKNYNNKNFEQAIKVVLKHEGFVSNDPDDPGGYTKYGISLSAAKQFGDLDGDGFADLDLDHDGDVDVDDMQSLTEKQAIGIYKKVYWRDVYDTFPSVIAIKTFDFAVNMGHKQAHKLLQRAVRAAHPNNIKLVDDGILGDKSITAIKVCMPSVLIAAFKSEAAGFYRVLATKRPKSKKYLNGWLNRAYS